MDKNEGKRNLKKLGVDIILLLLVGIPILIYFLIGTPYKRGFFCDDESLKHPYHDSTVPSFTLYIYGLIFPICMMIFIEFFNTRKERRKVSLGNHEISAWVWRAYCVIVVFGFGASCSQLSTDIMKYTVGRLRPHFFTVCKPLIDCTLPDNRHRYIEIFNCTANSNQRLLKEMRLSFPSGHSSFSMYTMFYIAIYLQARWPWRSTLLLRNTIQYGSILLAIYTGMTRISDYKHHWSDVLTGLLLGMFVATLVARYVSDLFTKKTSLLPIDGSETETELRNGRSQL